MANNQSNSPNDGAQPTQPAFNLTSITDRNNHSTGGKKTSPPFSNFTSNSPSADSLDTTAAANTLMAIANSPPSTAVSTPPSTFAPPVRAMANYSQQQEQQEQQQHMPPPPFNNGMVNHPGTSPTSPAPRSRSRFANMVANRSMQSSASPASSSASSANMANQQQRQAPQSRAMAQHLVQQQMANSQRQWMLTNELVILLTSFSEWDSSLSPAPGNWYFAESVWVQCSMFLGLPVMECVKVFSLPMGMYRVIASIGHLTKQGLIVGITFNLATRNIEMEMDERWDAFAKDPNPQVRALTCLRVWTNNPFPWYDQCQKIKSRWDLWMSRISNPSTNPNITPATLLRPDIMQRPDVMMRPDIMVRPDILKRPRLTMNDENKDMVEVGDPGEWQHAAKRVKSFASMSCQGHVGKEEGGKGERDPKGKGKAEAPETPSKQEDTEMRGVEMQPDSGKEKALAESPETARICSDIDMRGPHDRMVEQIEEGKVRKVWDNERRRERYEPMSEEEKVAEKAARAVRVVKVKKNFGSVLAEVIAKEELKGMMDLEGQN